MYDTYMYKRWIICYNFLYFFYIIKYRNNKVQKLPSALKRNVREMFEKIGTLFCTLAHKVEKMEHRLASWHVK